MILRKVSNQISTYNQFILIFIILVSLAVVACAPNPGIENSPSNNNSASPSNMMGANFSSYIGGTDQDFIRDVAVDGNGNLYITGGTASSNFTTTSGVYDRSFNGWMDVFVAKLNPSGNLVWSTLLGGPNYDRAYGIEVDSQGYVYIAGRAGDGFPTTAGVIQTGFAGDNDVNSLYGAQDGFIAKLAPDGGQLIWSTYFGGPDRSFIRDLDIDSSGNVYIAETDVSSPNPHITPGAFQTSLSGGYDGIVAKLSSDARQVSWATYLGGTGQFDLGTPSIRVDSNGNAIVAGGTTSNDIPVSQTAYDHTLAGNNDYYVAKFSPTGSFLFGTYIGGSGAEFSETHSLALDGQGNVIVGGTTTSDDFPTTSNAYQTTFGGRGGQGTGANSNYSGDNFIAKISKDGTTLLASTYVGGRYGEGLEGIGVSSSGNVYISGTTYSDNFPVTTDAFQSTIRGSADFFGCELSSDLSQLIYSTYAGGSNNDFGRTSTVDASGNFYVAGMTQSTNWPLVNALQTTENGNWDGAIIKFSAGAQPLPTNYSQFIYLPIARGFQ